MPSKIIFPTALLCSMLLPLSCKKSLDYDKDTFSGSKVMVLGHSGMGVFYSMPANSFESVEPCIRIGADGSEIDIQMTRDSVLVVFHDGDLSGQTYCSGRIYDHSWNAIGDCRYTRITKPVNLVSLDDLLSRIPNCSDYYFSLDCKLDPTVPDASAYQDQLIRAIRRSSEKFGMTGHLFIEGYENFLKRCQSLGLSNKLFLLSNNDDQPADKARANNFFGISTNEEISKEDIDHAHSMGIYVMLWYPGNYAQNKAVLEKGPDIIQSDDPISLLKLLQRYNYENVTP